MKPSITYTNGLYLTKLFYILTKQKLNKILNRNTYVDLHIGYGNTTTDIRTNQISWSKN